MPEPPDETPAAPGAFARRARRRSTGTLAALLLLSLGVFAREAPLAGLAPGLNIDRERISVSGVSSGAYMAQQFHVVHSSRVMGAGLIAGGPYRCAAGVYLPWSWFDPTGLYAATGRCSNTNPFWFYGGAPDVASSLNETRHEARLGNIDEPDGLSGDRVWLLSGSEDATVPRAVVDTLANYYQHFIASGDLRYEKLEGAAHAMITENRGNACGASGPPFINDCDFDAAGMLLAHIHGGLRPRANTVPAASLRRFDQAPFFDAGDASVSLNDFGYLYVPPDCLQGTSCALHVAFHGCQQSAAQIGDRFAREAGYNEWAETNRIVILYPQARPWAGTGFSARANPKGCWDWWGYSGPGYHRRSGGQIAAVAAMLDALIGEPVFSVPGAR